ncbi:MAG: hypothetical protein AB7G11_04835 [Phycisphaerales bacterium]
MAGNKPVHEIRIGRIKASIWANEIQGGGTRHSVTVRRLYKDESGWKSTDSFDRDDLPLVEKVADRALLWIFEQSQRSE